MNLTSTLDLSFVIETVEAAGLMKFTCTIKTPPTVRDAVGRRSSDPADWNVLEGHENIPCFVAPGIIPRVTDSDETKSPDFISQKSEKHVLLNGFYPAILQSYRASIGYTDESDQPVSLDYDILGVETDSQRTMTRMAVQVYQL